MRELAPGRRTLVQIRHGVGSGYLLVIPERERAWRANCRAGRA